MKVSVWQYHARSLPWSWLTEEDDWGLQLPPKRKVFRSHYHSQFQWVRGESGSLGLVWWHAVQGRSSKRWIALRCHVFLPLCVLKMVYGILYLSFSSLVPGHMSYRLQVIDPLIHWWHGSRSLDDPTGGVSPRHIFSGFLWFLCSTCNKQKIRANARNSCLVWKMLPVFEKCWKKESDSGHGSQLLLMIDHQKARGCCFCFNPSQK